MLQHCVDNIDDHDKHWLKLCVIEGENQRLRPELILDCLAQATLKVCPLLRD